jgi:hypothetical protein
VFRVRKLILMETKATDEAWPARKIEETQSQLYTYLADFVPEKWGYSKHAIMGPVGKLLGIIAASKFGENVDSYVGYIANIHDQQSKKHLTLSGMENLKNAISNLVELRKDTSERAFLKILSSVDYGVYYLKVKEISERSEAKKVGNEKT